MFTLSGSRKRGSDRAELAPCSECPGRLARLIARIRSIAGLVSLAAAAWWSLRALLEHHDRHVAAIVDEEYGLRITPLRPDERAAALELERGIASELRL